MAELLCANSGRERTSAIVYAVGWTQHTTGVQIIRTAGILQLLLGNIGPAGRRHHGDARPLHHPGLDRPRDPVRPAARLPAAAGRRRGPRDARLLCRARGHADRLLGQLPQVRRQPAQGVVRRRGHAGERLRLRLAAARRRRPLAAALLRPHGQGRGEGLLPVRPEPRRRRAERRLHRAGLRNLDWLVVADWFETESAVFWKDDPTGPPPARDQDRGVLHPRRRRAGEGGQLTNTQRLLQWHDKAVDPPGDCRSDAWFVYNLGKRLKQLYAGSTDPQGPAAAAPHLGLRLRRAAAPARRHAAAASRASRTWRRCCRRSTATGCE